MSVLWQRILLPYVPLHEDRMRMSCVIIDKTTVNLLYKYVVQIRQNRIANTWKIGYIYGWYC